MTTDENVDVDARLHQAYLDAKARDDGRSVALRDLTTERGDRDA